jgi:ubiquinone/menaquinone biosynthesis C-methylase UbiE
MITSYEPFSEEPEYLAANRAFIEALPLRGRARILDLACGTGILSAMMFQANPELEAAQLDLSRESLDLARQRLEAGGYVRPPGARPRALGLLEASADRVPARDGSFDAVVMGNAIHILPDPDRLLAEVSRVLRVDGLFAFNTSFYAGTYPPGTEKLYHHWLMEALRHLAARGEGRRQRRGAAKAFARPWPSTEEWTERLERHGFGIHAVHERTVMMNRRSFEAVGAYAGLASVLLSGYPVPLACEALQAAAGPAFQAAGLGEVPRLWLEISAMKKAGGSTHVH